MPRDPVCGVILNDKTAKFKISHEGETIFFWCEMQEEIQKESKEIHKVTWILCMRLASSSKILLVL